MYDTGSSVGQAAVGGYADEAILEGSCRRYPNNFDRSYLLVVDFKSAAAHPQGGK